MPSKKKTHLVSIENQRCSGNIKNKSSVMLDDALEDTVQRVHSSKNGQPQEMLTILDNWFASSRTAIRFSTITKMCTDRFNPKNHNIEKFIDKFV